MNALTALWLLIRSGSRICVLCACACLVAGPHQPDDFKECSYPVRLTKDKVKGTYVGYNQSELFFYRLDLNIDKESQFIVLVNPLIKLTPEKMSRLKPLTYYIKTWSVNGAEFLLSGESDNPIYPKLRIVGVALSGQSVSIDISGDVLGGGGKTVLLAAANLKKSMEIAAKIAGESEGKNPATARPAENKNKIDP